MTISSRMSDVLPGDLVPFASSVTTTTSSSSSARSAQRRPAWSAKTPVKATLQMRLLDASSNVGFRKARGKGSFNWCVGRELNLASKPVIW